MLAHVLGDFVAQEAKDPKVCHHTIFSVFLTNFIAAVQEVVKSRENASGKAWEEDEEPPKNKKVKRGKPKSKFA